jgi:hypothetical protein
MKKNITSIIMAAALAAIPLSMDANNYFFSVSGAGEKDGTSWENAAPADYLGNAISSLTSGDAVYIMAGNYAPDRNQGFWTIPAGVTIRGGYPATMKGTDTAITYPSAAQTVWSADLDGDGAGDNGTQPFVVVDNTSGTAATFAKTIMSGITIRDAVNTGSADYKGSAMIIKHATMEFEGMQFLNNQINGKTSAGKLTRGGVVVVWASDIYFKNCVWRDNKSACTGVALQGRQSNGGSNDATLGTCNLIFDRCEFTNNISFAPDDAANCKYGGALTLCDRGGTMTMVNCVVTGSHISWAGAMCRMGSYTTMYAANNTWFDCTCSYDKRHSGDILSMGTYSTLYAANNIAVTPTDGRTEMMATMFIQDQSCHFYSGGYNVWGSLMNASSDSQATTDNISKDNVQTTVFGTNEYKDNGCGQNSIEPLETFRGVPTADLVSWAAAKGFPKQVDLSVDQRGYNRPAETVPGSFDSKAQTVTAIETIAVNNVKKANDNRIYNLNGQQVNGSHLTKGIYIINGKKVIVK